jgi:hypothetical protein
VFLPTLFPASRLSHPLFPHTSSWIHPSSFLTHCPSGIILRKEKVLSSIQHFKNASLEILPLKIFWLN